MTKGKPWGLSRQTREAIPEHPPSRLRTAHPKRGCSTGHNTFPSDAKRPCAFTLLAHQGLPVRRITGPTGVVSNRADRGRAKMQHGLPRSRRDLRVRRGSILPDHMGQFLRDPRIPTSRRRKAISDFVSPTPRSTGNREDDAPQTPNRNLTSGDRASPHDGSFWYAPPDLHAAAPLIQLAWAC